MLEYFIEIRQRMLRALVLVLIVFCVAFYFGQQLFTLLALPLLKHLTHGQSIVAIGIATPLITPLKLSFYAALFVAMPYCLYQFWAFISPALYSHERRLIWLLLAPSVILFYAGIAFAYFLVFPMIFNFFSSALPFGVNFLPDMEHYLDFALHLFVAFGICFQLPVLIVFLAVTDLVTVEKLAESRAYVVVLAFTVGMLLTPPDVLSQVMLAVPMCILYEVSILVAKMMKKSYTTSSSFS